MNKIEASIKSQRRILEDACHDFIKAASVLQYWRYLPPAVKLLAGNKQLSLQKASVSYEAAFLAARDLKKEQFLEVPTFERLQPLVHYLLVLYQQAVQSRHWTNVRIIHDAVTALVESYPQHEPRIVRAYHTICKRESPKGRPAKRLSVTKVENLLSAGLSLEQIGKRLHVHRNTIYRHATSNEKLKTALNERRVKYRRHPPLVESQVSAE